MNERVKELIWKADQYSISNVERGRDSEFFHTIAMNKLAELIVRECVGIVAVAVDQREPASTYVDKIKQHWAVES